MVLRMAVAKNEAYYWSDSHFSKMHQKNLCIA
jgi:hypothetical protein